MKIHYLAKVVASSLKISLTIILVTISCRIYAEYYLAAPSPCGYHRYYYKAHHIHHKKHHRHYSPYGVSISYVCPCPNRVWVRVHCNSCSRYVGVYYVQPAYYKNYGYREDLGYDPDVATGDDNQSVYPDMDIDQ